MVYTSSYISIGIGKRLIQFRIYEVAYPIPHTQYSPLFTLSCCPHSHDSGHASKDCDPDDDDYDDELASEENDGDEVDGDDDGDERNGDEDVSNGSFAGENEHVVLNVRNLW